MRATWVRKVGGDLRTLWAAHQVLQSRGKDSLTLPPSKLDFSKQLLSQFKLRVNSFLNVGSGPRFLDLKVTGESEEGSDGDKTYPGYAGFQPACIGVVILAEYPKQALFEIGFCSGG
jgi:hypothetical protein